MSEPIIIPFPKSSINPGPKTVQFATLENPTQQLISEIDSQAGSILNWRPMSIFLSGQIQFRLGGENVSFEAKHELFADALGKAHLSLNAKKTWMTRQIQKMKSDQLESGYISVNIDSDRRKNIGNGEFIQLPTLYSQGNQFPDLRNHVQELAIETNFPDWELNKRRRKLREILSEYLFNHGCKRIIREKKANQLDSEIKQAINTEIRIDKESELRKFHNHAKGMLESGINLLKLGLKYESVVGKAHREFDAMLMEFWEIQKKRSEIKIKLNGVQPR